MLYEVICRVLHTTADTSNADNGGASTVMTCSIINRADQGVYDEERR